MARLRTRLDLQDYLKEVLGSDDVYYEPPDGARLSYPCICYQLGRMSSRAANNRPDYLEWDSYTVMYIVQEALDTRDEDSTLEKLRASEGFVFDRTYVLEKLHHYVFTAYLA